MNNKLCIGIDLGTTNSVLASINVRPNGNIVSKVVDIPRAVDVYNSLNAEGGLSTKRESTLPSCVFYRQERGYEALVGDFAKLQYPLRPHLVAKSIKSQMGKPFAEGLSDDVPDKTPAEISSRILKHLINEASKIYRCEIKDAVITVPANFDPSMCKATLDAAEMAGIQVRNPDGSERPILLSEPKAVIYDLINQIHNGEISDIILDLSSMKRVLVFDLGGGTLDITMHEIKRRENAPEILKIDDIATNRYTLLGGDNFDQAIAQEMFKRYINQYSKNQSVIEHLNQYKKMIMAQLLNYAENVKLDLSMRMENSSYSSTWDDDDESIIINTGGSMGGVGYSYDDKFSKEEVEKILSSFMGNELKYSDYKNFSSVTATNNIIYPILDVLNKASEKLGISDVKVDAVIVNGGMSKFYMITERLKNFFGLDPIVALDPDQSVARGAAVYHYLLTQHSELQDDMKIIGDFEEIKSEPRKINIEWSKPILNDALFIGAKNGAVQEIIPTGAELPYQSPIMTGFSIDPLQRRIDIPIKSRNLDGSYRTIALGNIIFSQISSEKLYVAFTIKMQESKVISMNAWTSYDVDGNSKIEEGQTQINIANFDKPAKLISDSFSTGLSLNAGQILRKYIQLCENFNKAKYIHKKSDIAQELKEIAANIQKAANRSEFVPIILENLANNKVNDEAKMRLFTLARRIATDFNALELKQLAAICMTQLNTAILGFHLSKLSGPRTNADIQAIYTLSICGKPEQMKRLTPLHSNKTYRNACLYAHAKTLTEIEWILNCLYSDVNSTKKRSSNLLQITGHAVAVALKNSPDCPVTAKRREDVLELLIGAINSKKLLQSALSVVVMALGTMCDSRTIASPFSKELTLKTEYCINSISSLYPYDIATFVDKNCTIALKLIHGENLTIDEETYLLTKLEKEQ